MLVVVYHVSLLCGLLCMRCCFVLVWLLVVVAVVCRFLFLDW